MEVGRARELAVARARARARARQLADEANAPGFGEAIGAGVLQGGADVLGTLARAGDAAAETLTGTSPTQQILGQTPKEVMQDQNDAFDARYGDSTPATVGRVGGQVATVLPALGGAGALARGAANAAPRLAPAVNFAGGSGRVGSKVAAGSLQGASAAGLTSGASDNPAADMGYGAVFGGALPLAYHGAKAAGRSVRDATLPSISPEATRLAQRATEHGIPINAAQLSSSPSLRLADSVTRRIPFSGAAKHLDDQQVAFNRAVGRTIGANDDRITSDVFARAKGETSKEFERLSAQNILPMTDDLSRSLQTIKDDAARFGSVDTARAVASVVDDEIGGKMVGGVLPGRAYQSIDSLIGRLAKGGGEKSIHLNELRDALRRAMDDAIVPEDRAAWMAARQRWRNLKTIEPLVAKDGVEGNIAAAQLQGRITADKAGKAAHAAGRTGEIGELAQIGQRFLKDTVPNSGTADRAAVMGLFGGAPLAALVEPTVGLAAAGAVGGGRLTQSLLNNPSYRNLLISRSLNSGSSGGSSAAQTGVKSLANRLAPYGVPLTILPAANGVR